MVSTSSVFSEGLTEAIEITEALAAQMSFLEILTGILYLIGLPLVVLELILLIRSRRLNWQRASGMLTSIFCFIPLALTDALTTGVLFGGFIGLGILSPLSVSVNGATAILCLVLVDLTYYWEHRLGHQVHVLWALYHAVHHSADHFDQTIALRISFVDALITPFFYLPLVLAGFHPLLVLTCFAVVLAWQQWIHTELVGRAPLIDGWLNTPSNHRVHHGRNPQYIDKNYGGILMLWDRLFGTYEPEVEKVDYGLVEPLQKRNPIAVHFHKLGQLLSALIASPSIAATVKTLFGRP